MWQLYALVIGGIPMILAELLCLIIDDNEVVENV